MLRAGRLRLSICSRCLGQCEDHVDGCVDLDRPVIDDVRTVVPGFDCIERSLLQHGWTGDDVEVLDGAVFPDGHLKDDGS